MTVFGNLPTTLTQIGGFDEMALGITGTNDGAAGAGAPPAKIGFDTSHGTPAPSSPGR